VIAVVVETISSIGVNTIWIGSILARKIVLVLIQVSMLAPTAPSPTTQQATRKPSRHATSAPHHTAAPNPTTNATMTAPSGFCWLNCNHS
jgi:hypothetical protein